MKQSVLGLLLSAASAAPGAGAPQDVFPMAVWYGGGKARAPMLEADPRAKKEVWRKDLQQIRALGVNTGRGWSDWGTGERKKGERSFRDPALPLRQSISKKEAPAAYP